MPRPKLEVFETAETTPLTPESAHTTLAALEEGKLSAYETGYQAGWDDAAAAQHEDQTRISAELARNLQALALTWQEARSHILTAVEPLLTAIIDRVLPEMSRATLAPLVLETLMPLVNSQADQPAVLVLNPMARARVEALLTQATGLPLTIHEEPTLSEGQVYLRLGPTEAKVDLTRVIAEIASAVHAFFTLEQESQTDGRPD